MATEREDVRREGPRRQSRLVVLFVAGLLLLNYPLLSLFSRDVFVGGVPLLYVVIFSLWAVLIAATAWMMR